MDDTYGPRRLSQTRRDSRGLCTCILSSLCTQVRERSCCVRTLNERSGGCLNHQTLAPQSRRGAAGRGKSNFCRSDSTTVFARSPPAPSPPQPVVVGPYMSIFELFYYLITSYHYLATVYCSLPPPPYAACVMPLRAHPLAAVCATAPGGWAPGQGARGKANHCISMRAPTG